MAGQLASSESDGATDSGDNGVSIRPWRRYRAIVTK